MSALCLPSSSTCLPHPATTVRDAARASHMRTCLRPLSRCKVLGIRAQAAAGVISQSYSAPAQQTPANSDGYQFVCPICHDTEFNIQPGRPMQDLSCSRCARTFEANPTYTDLTVTSGTQQRVFSQSSTAGREIFRSPIVSFVYERGWRQGFSWAGFPGADVEYNYAIDYLLPVGGEVLVDLSCGSGLFARRFAKSGRFAGVVATDFSENMLRQAKQNFDADTSISPSAYMLLRADAGRLPFATGSVAAIHAGAAIHCWPDPTAAFAEISRVLRPGGVFVASTFLKVAAPLGAVLGDDVVRPLNQLESQLGRGSYRWWEEEELRELSALVGLQKFRRHRSGRFIMFCVTKPERAA